MKNAYFINFTTDTTLGSYSNHSMVKDLRVAEKKQGLGGGKAQMNFPERMKIRLWLETEI